MFSSPPTENDARAKQSGTKKKQRRPRLHFPSIVISIRPPPASKEMWSHLDPPVRGERTTNRERRVAIKDISFSPAPQCCKSPPSAPTARSLAGRGLGGQWKHSRQVRWVRGRPRRCHCHYCSLLFHQSFENFLSILQSCHHPSCSNDVTNNAFANTGE